MSTALTTKELSGALRRIIDKLGVCADELNLLDAQLGDGDLGVTLVRGGRAVAAELPNLPEDLGLALQKCAQAFTKLSGSTFGTLLATGLMSAAKATKGRTEVPWVEVSSLLDTALQAMSRRGGAQLGDKTILDALESVRAATQGLDDPVALVTAADQAVAQSIERFRKEPSRQGRARIFGETTIGKDDPGMVGLKRIIEAIEQDPEP
jgi:phosphoenolpyruvate---glycerone phosphotransferase subunit DhaL